MKAKTREHKILSLAPIVRHFVKLAWEKNNRADIDDLANDGWVAAIHAVDRYKKKHGAKLSYFAKWHIQGGITDAIRRLDVLSRGERQKVKDGLRQAPSVISIEENPIQIVSRNAFREVTAGDKRLDVLVIMRAAHLNKREKWCIEQYFLQGRQMHAMAKEYGCSESLISVTTKSAIEKMKKAAGAPMQRVRIRLNG